MLYIEIIVSAVSSWNPKCCLRSIFNLSWVFGISRHDKCKNEALSLDTKTIVSKVVAMVLFDNNYNKFTTV